MHGVPPVGATGGRPARCRGTLCDNLYPPHGGLRWNEGHGVGKSPAPGDRRSPLQTGNDALFKHRDHPEACSTSAMVGVFQRASTRWPARGMTRLLQGISPVGMPFLARCSTCRGDRRSPARCRGKGAATLCDNLYEPHGGLRWNEGHAWVITRTGRPPVAPTDGQ